MKEVIYIDEEKTNGKPVEFTYRLMNKEGWIESAYYPENYDKIVYLGKCPFVGDMFAAYYKDGSIRIYRGHLNSGTY